MRSPVKASQRLILVSAEPEKKRSPSQLNLTMVTGLSWPLRMRGRMLMSYKYYLCDAAQQILSDCMQKEDTAETDIRNNKIKEGWLVKRSRVLKEWKKRWMVLTRTHLYSFEQKGVYRSPTEKIPLRQVSTIKSFYKNQYQRPQVFRIESDDTCFYLSAQDHQDKWSWMTAVEKMTEALANPAAQDSQNLIRQTLRMSTAVRQSALIPRKSSFAEGQDTLNILKKLKLRTESRILGIQYEPKPRLKQLKMYKMSSVTWNEGVGQQEQLGGSSTGPKGQRVVEVVQRIVEVKVPVEVEKIIERERIVHVRDNENTGGNLLDLFSALINCKLDDPKPLLDFVAFLGLSGIERYQAVALQFCCQRDSHRFLSQLMLQALNEEILQERLNRYTAFIYILTERDSQFFYASDLKILVEIVVREIQLYRSDLNQMINLQLLKALLNYHMKALAHKRNQIQAIAAEIATMGPLQNREIAQEICVLIGH